MSGQYGTQRFGWDAPARISTSAVMLQEATEMPPETLHGPVGFMPSIVSGDGTSTGSANGDDNSKWKAFPDQLNLYWYQGDDIQIPLYFTNPVDPLLDMSNENGYTWKAQMRTRHRFYAYEVNEFVIESEALPPTPPDDRAHWYHTGDAVPAPPTQPVPRRLLVGPDVDRALHRTVLPSANRYRGMAPV